MTLDGNTEKYYVERIVFLLSVLFVPSHFFSNRTFISFSMLQPSFCMPQIHAIYDWEPIICSVECILALRRVLPSTSPPYLRFPGVWWKFRQTKKYGPLFMGPIFRICHTAVFITDWRLYTVKAATSQIFTALLYNDAMQQIYSRDIIQYFFPVNPHNICWQPCWVSAKLSLRRNCVC